MNNNRIKRSVVLSFLILLGLLLTGCGATDVGEPITADNLSGLRVGVMVGYSPDYILTKDSRGMEIYRYDTYSDMYLALSFNRIDAIATEREDAYFICREEADFEIGPAITEPSEYGYMFYSERNELREEFNRFIKEFRKTEEYADMLNRVEATLNAPYKAKKVENIVTTDRVIKVAAYADWEPVSYINTSTDEWEGCDVELITHFANSIGAELVLEDKTWNQMLLEVANGMVDLILSPDSLLMAKDLEMSGNIVMSEPVHIKDIVLVIDKEE
ncbi:MAG: transporter substrate-binding domain-containing protein [Syntrophomonadales bacterium]|jgi:ABC-type amino acid transport substrate-binding protein